MLIHCRYRPVDSVHWVHWLEHSRGRTQNIRESPAKGLRTLCSQSTRSNIWTSIRCMNENHVDGEMIGDLHLPYDRYLIDASHHGPSSPVRTRSPSSDIDHLSHGRNSSDMTKHPVISGWGSIGVLTRGCEYKMYCTIWPFELIMGLLFFRKSVLQRGWFRNDAQLYTWQILLTFL